MSKNTTDTNQASEDELTKIIDKVYLFGMNGGLGYEKFDNELSPNDAKAAIQSIIRTEKLKLLAVVRERVVGEYETEYSNLDGDAGYWEKHGRNGMREKQNANLVKLEAEL